MRQHAVLQGLTTALLCLLLTSPASAFTQSELQTAAGELFDRGIMVGDDTGAMRLGDPLSRMELAVLLTRLHDTPKQADENRVFYATHCSFLDVPAWARQYAGYCTYHGLMVGYGGDVFGAEDPVTPAAACTVVLRYLDLPNLVWDYTTACQSALALGLTTAATIEKTEVTRGDMAVMLYRAMVMLESIPSDTASRPAAGTSEGTGDGYLTNGKPVTEENVLELLHQLEQDWPTGTVWGTHNTPGTHKNEVPCTAARKIMHEYPVSEYYGCGGYAAMISSLVFGDASNPGRRVEDLSQIRPGDIIFRVRNDNGKVWHVLVALETPNENHAFHVTDGNHGEAVDWPDPQSPYPHNNLDSYGEDKTYRLEAWTRYPEYVPCTGKSTNIWLAGIS